MTNDETRRQQPEDVRFAHRLKSVTDSLPIASVLCSIAILFIVIGWCDARRRIAIRQDSVAVPGHYARANHMSLSRGKVVYMTPEGTRHGITPPFFGRLSSDESIPVEYRKSNPEDGWLASSPPYRMTVPALLMFIGGEFLIVATVVFLFNRQDVGDVNKTLRTKPDTASANTGTDETKKLLAGLAGSSFVLFAAIAAWYGSDADPIPSAITPVEPEQVGHAAAIAMQNPIRTGHEPEIEDELPIESVVSLKEIDEFWRTDLEIKDKPAGEVLEQLCIDCGWQFDRRGSYFEEYAHIQESLNRRVSVSLKNQSRLEAIENVCRQLDLIPEYSLRTLSLKNTFGNFSQRLPVAHAGPFLIEITGIHADEKTGSGWIIMRLIAANLHPAAIARLRRTADPRYPHLHDPVQLELLSAVGPKAEILTDGRIKGRRRVTATHHSLIIQEVFLIKNLTRSVNSMSLKGRFAFSLPSSIKTLTFDQPEEGAEAAEDGLSARIPTWKSTATTSSLVMEVVGAEPQRISVIGHGGGTPKPAMSARDTMSNTPEGAPRCRVRASFKGNPSRLEVRAIDRVEDVDISFAIDNIPLRNAEKMPESIAPLTFDGEQPLTLKVDSIETGISGYPVPAARVTLSVVNLANWPLRNGKARFLFTDAEGKIVTRREWPFRCDRRQELPTQESREFSLSVQSVSKSSIAATVELIQAEFTDGTVWSTPAE